MEEILGKIGFDWHVALANLVNCLIIFFILKKFAFGPIQKILRERRATIEKGIADAKENAEKMKATTVEYEATLQKARAEANAIFDKTKKDAETKRAEILAQAQAEMAASIEQGKKVIEAEKNKMLADAKNELASLVVSATEKVLQEKNG